MTFDVISSYSILASYMTSHCIHSACRWLELGVIASVSREEPSFWARQWTGFSEPRAGHKGLYCRRRPLRRSSLAAPPSGGLRLWCNHHTGHEQYHIGTEASLLSSALICEFGDEDFDCFCWFFDETRFMPGMEN